MRWGEGERTSYFTKQGTESRLCSGLAQGPDTSTELGLELKMLTFFYQVTKFTKCKPLESFLQNLGADMYLKL